MGRGTLSVVLRHKKVQTLPLRQTRFIVVVTLAKAFCCQRGREWPVRVSMTSFAS